jgi:hypothetical protein
MIPLNSSLSSHRLCIPNLRFILQIERQVDSTCTLTSRSGPSSLFSPQPRKTNIKVKWNRLFRASEHAFSSSEFHRLCDNQGPTIVLVQAENGRVAVGYSCVSWNTQGGEFPNARGFVCSVDPIDSTLRLFKPVPRQCSIGCYGDPYGPWFKGAFCIYDSFHTESNSKLVSGFEIGDVDPLELFGMKAFKVKEVSRSILLSFSARSFKSS